MPHLTAGSHMRAGSFARIGPRVARTLAALVILTLGLLFLDSAATLAQNGPPPTPIDTTLQALLDKADRNGSVKVIIGLREAGPFKPESSLPSASAVSGQKASISRAQDAVLNALARDRKHVLARYKHIPYLALSLDRAGLEHLFSSGLAASIKEDTPVPPAMVPETALIRADNVQAAGDDGDGWVVVILDTGIDETHPYFGSRIVLNQQACFSNNNGDGADDGGTTLCPNGQPTQTGLDAASGQYAADVDVAGCVFDLCDHGTHVAGIAAGNANGVLGAPGSGVAPHAKILPIQVFTNIDNSRFCGGFSPCVLTYQADYIAALDYVLTIKDSIPGARIAAVNMSLGGAPLATSPCDSDPAKPAIDNLLAAGIPTVIAAGNDGSSKGIDNPGCISSAVSVGATTNADAIASFSNRSASMLDLFAPGVGVQSSFPVDTFGADTGTSMSTPMVSGAFADLREAAPATDVPTLLAVLKGTGAPITVGGGSVSRIDLLPADNLLKGIDNPPRAPFAPNPSDGASGVSGAGTLTWKGADPDTTLGPDPLTYDVLLDTSPDPSTAQPGCTGLTTPACPLSGLDGGITYHWKVVATDSHGQSTTGPVWSFKTRNDAPNTPSAPAPSAGSTWASLAPSLAWTGGDPDPSDTVSYKVFLSVSHNPTTLVCGGLAAPGCVPTLGLKADTRYYWKVVATDNHGASTSGPVWSFTTLFNAPTLSGPRSGTSRHTGTVRLGWRRYKGAGGYSIEIYDDPGLAPGSLVQQRTTINPFYLTKSLDFGLYYWRVQVKDAFGQSQFSPLRSFEVTLNQSPRNQARLTDRTPTFRWKAVRGATYELEVFTDNSSETARLASTLFSTPAPRNQYPVSNAAPLAPGTYFWRVRVVGGTWTPAWTFTIK